MYALFVVLTLEFKQCSLYFSYFFSQISVFIKDLYIEGRVSVLSVVARQGHSFFSLFYNKLAFYVTYSFRQYGNSNLKKIKYFIYRFI